MSNIEKIHPINTPTSVTYKIFLSNSNKSGFLTFYLSLIIDFNINLKAKSQKMIQVRGIALGTRVVFSKLYGLEIVIFKKGQRQVV